MTIEASSRYTAGSVCHLYSAFSPVDPKLPPTPAAPLAEASRAVSKHRLFKFCLVLANAHPTATLSCWVPCRISAMFMGSRWSPQLPSYQEGSSQIHGKQTGSKSSSVQISRPPLNNQNEEIPGNGKNLASDLSSGKLLMRPSGFDDCE